MKSADTVLAVNNDIPINTDQPVHSGKVRSVYWLNAADSKRLIQDKQYPVAEDTPLAVMVISDRISAFECIWHAFDGMQGIPGKGAALNAISNHWFTLFKQHGLARSHILDTPHPLVWIVQKAKPVLIEAIARQYITGSMWRAYDKGEREFCGSQLAEGLKKDSKLEQLLITPSTKGVLKNIPGVPEQDDVNVSRQDILNNYSAFGFEDPSDVAIYENLLTKGFETISTALAKLDQIFVDTKFEFGYVSNQMGDRELIYMDEVGTPDSSRIWDGKSYRNGRVVENSKEEFRQLLLQHFPDPDVLLNKNRMVERSALARDTALPLEIVERVSNTYKNIAEQITGKKLALSDNPRDEITQILHQDYGLIS